MSDPTADANANNPHTQSPNRAAYGRGSSIWNIAAAATTKGSFRIFRLFGIDVYMHWTWFVVVYFQIRFHPLGYSTPVWKVAEYLATFGIVLIHEFGHSLACRQVGGVANQIVLWPLGGVAYVSPPPRPGAYLWSIVAGPLVNLVLVPVTLVAAVLAVGIHGLAQPTSDLQNFVCAIFVINSLLLVFNLLPIYPLDGGQIVRALLWFAIGPIRSLMVVTLIGSVVGGVAAVLALLTQHWWILALAIFAVMRSIAGFRQSRQIIRAQNSPVRNGFACPSCGAAPLQGKFWKCARCQKPFDTFAFPQATCPHCGGVFAITQCMSCRAQSSIDAWRIRDSQ